MTNSLRFIASYDDTVQFCGVDESLGERYQTIFAESQGRVSTFDPIMSAAANMEAGVLDKVDVWTRVGGSSFKAAKRGFGTFDSVKYTKYFIETQKAHLENPEESSGLLRTGFDAYSYLMAHEEEILAMYKDSEMSLLQKAALHYVEMNGEIAELDYVRYIASYDDLVLGSVSGRPFDQTWEQWLPTVGKWHYENVGRAEIESGIRAVTPFFDAVKYIASYAGVQDSFKNEDGSFDETKCAIAFITFGAFNGLTRDGFQPNVFLANYPEVLAEDIYVNGEISTVKVAKIWLERFKDGITLDKFDPVDFKEVMGLDEATDPFTSFVQAKSKEYKRLLQKQGKMFYKMTHMCRGMDPMTLLAKPLKSKSKKVSKPEPEPEVTPDTE